MKRKSAGFTLLELVVVVAVMGLISSMAMDVYTDNSNQKRFEATKERLAEIKFAIIGDPQMRVGSQAIQEGAFFKDMGRLPRNIAELVTPDNNDFCLHTTNYIVSTTIANAAACAAIVPLGSWTWTSEDSIKWKGPYLHNLQTFIDDKGTDVESDDTTHIVFFDSWGNTHPWDTPGSKDLTNFGWEFDISSGDLKISSAGLNRNSGGLNYEEDKFTTIYATELKYIHDISVSAGYCIELGTSTPPVYKINQNFDKNECDDEDDTDYLWAVFL